jgi:hypothetical protein
MIVLFPLFHKEGLGEILYKSGHPSKIKNPPQSPFK